MADHATLIGIRDSALFELLHRPERRLETGLHLVNELVGEPDPTDIEVESELLVLVKPVNVSPPQSMGIFVQTSSLVVVLGGAVVDLGQLRRDIASDGETEAPISVATSRKCEEIVAQNVG